ncbi:MAG: hypothetical protein J7J65_03225 [Candidatus Korarchaeota archaeon]|nr:hypothetical protein [Candidatus Korarchaeota archaeon]
MEGIKEFLDLSIPADIQPIAYTKEEFLGMAREERIVRKALGYGILLAGDNEILNILIILDKPSNIGDKGS